MSELDLSRLHTRVDQAVSEFLQKRNWVREKCHVGLYYGIDHKVLSIVLLARPILQESRYMLKVQHRVPFASNELSTVSSKAILQLLESAHVVKQQTEHTLKKVEKPVEEERASQLHAFTKVLKRTTDADEVRGKPGRVIKAIRTRPMQD